MEQEMEKMRQEERRKKEEEERRKIEEVRRRREEEERRKKEEEERRKMEEEIRRIEILKSGMDNITIGRLTDSHQLKQQELIFGYVDRKWHKTQIPQNIADILKEYYFYEKVFGDKGTNQMEFDIDNKKLFINWNWDAVISVNYNTIATEHRVGGSQRATSKTFDGTKDKLIEISGVVSLSISNPSKLYISMLCFRTKKNIVVFGNDNNSRKMMNAYTFHQFVNLNETFKTITVYGDDQYITGIWAQ